MSFDPYNPATSTSGKALLRHITPSSGLGNSTAGHFDNLSPGYELDNEAVAAPVAHKAEGWERILDAEPVLTAALGATAIEAGPAAEKEQVEIDKTASPDALAEIQNAPGPSFQEASQVLFRLGLLNNGHPSAIGTLIEQTRLRPMVELVDDNREFGGTPEGMNFGYGADPGALDKLIFSDDQPLTGPPSDRELPKQADDNKQGEQ